MTRLVYEITGQFQIFYRFQNFWKELFIIDFINTQILMTYFIENNSVFKKDILLTYQISNCFKNLFTLVFTDFPKASDIVNYDILICKLKNYGIRRNNLKWLESYLKNRK